MVVVVVVVVVVLWGCWYFLEYGKCFSLSVCSDHKDMSGFISFVSSTINFDIHGFPVVYLVAVQNLSDKHIT